MMLELSFSLMLLAAGPNAVPQDVKAFLERRMQCEHWAGEEPYDPPRLKEIQTALWQLRCDTIEAEELRIRGRYSNYPGVMEAIEDDPSE